MSKRRIDPPVIPWHDLPHGLSVPQAGRLIGLGKAASYDAAKRGDLPVLVIGSRKIVPRERLRQLLEGGP